MNLHHGLRQPGVAAALGAALLFGIGTPLAKGLLSVVDPWLIGTIVAGGMAGPVLLMLGISGMQAAGASLLLNAESVFTALLAWFVFRENFDRRIALGMLTIVAGAVVLSWPAAGTAGVAFSERWTTMWPALAVLGACLAWAIDNNMTRQISLADASWIASLKGLAAGSANLILALALGAVWPSLPQIAGGQVVGLFAYGVSLALFVVALRHLGTARTGAYFSVAPFFGAVLAVHLLGEPVSQRLARCRFSHGPGRLAAPDRAPPSRTRAPSTGA